MRAEYPNQLDYSGDDFISKSGMISEIGRRDLRIRHFSAGWQHSIDEEKQIKASVVRFEPGSLG